MEQIITYEMFGAIGDGVQDDMSAIVKAHEEANRLGLPVRAKEGAVYYISPKDMTALVRTNVDWTGAKFIIDDRKCENKDAPIFYVPSSEEELKLEFTSLDAGQTYIDNPLGKDVYVIVKNRNHMDYIRKGPNKNNGTARTDNFIVCADGSLPSPVSFDFTEITDITVRPIDSEKLVLKGGEFLTIANQEESFYNYHERNIMISRSNVEISGFTHSVTGELEHGAPYRGFLCVAECAKVYVHDCIFTGHRTYYTAAWDGSSVPMGTYDIDIEKAASVTLENCSQTTDILDKRYWGIMGTNFCRDLILENCKLSRFDAHQGVTNCTLRGCIFGWQRVSVIGKGTLSIENTEVHGRAFVSMRDDYGSTWQGDVIIKDSCWYPSDEYRAIFDARNDGTHDFGYECYLPANVRIDGFTVKEEKKDDSPIYILSNYGGDAEIPVEARKYMPHPMVSVYVKNIHTDRPVELCSRKEFVKDTIFVVE